jgi:hypothetical protein
VSYTDRDEGYRSRSPRLLRNLVNAASDDFPRRFMGALINSCLTKDSRADNDQLR